MKKRIFWVGCLVGIGGMMLGVVVPVFSQPEETPPLEEAFQPEQPLPSAAERIPVWREALNVQGSIVAVDLHLKGDLLESKVTGFMERVRPRLQNVLLVGPGVGRLGPVTRETVLAGLEEDPPYPTRRAGLLDLRAGSETTARGTLTRERFQHQLPLEEMRDLIRKKGKKARYEFWVYMESSQRGGKYLRFKFDLEKLPELILSGSESAACCGGR